MTCGSSSGRQERGPVGGAKARRPHGDRALAMQGDLANSIRSMDLARDTAGLSVVGRSGQFLRLKGDEIVEARTAELKVNDAGLPLAYAGVWVAEAVGR